MNSRRKVSASPSWSWASPPTAAPIASSASTSAKPAETRTQIKRIAERTTDPVGLSRAITDADIVLDERYAHPAYGVPPAATLDAIRLSARLEGMLTDPVYEGKSMQGMVDMVRSDAFPAGAKLLYVHLGGVPALTAYGHPFHED